MRAGNLIVGDDHDDQLLAVRDMLTKEGINIIELEEWCKDGSQLKHKAAVVDVFGLNPIEYEPFILQNHKQLKQCKPLFIYHNHLQEAEVSKVLAQTETEAFPLQLWPEHPLELVVEKE